MYEIAKANAKRDDSCVLLPKRPPFFFFHTQSVQSFMLSLFGLFAVQFFSLLKVLAKKADY